MKYPHNSTTRFQRGLQARLYVETTAQELQALTTFEKVHLSQQ
jgi:hypothetical protein